MPRHPDDINTPCYAGMHTLNGNGEVTGSYQIKDWGYINTVCHTDVYTSKVHSEGTELTVFMVYGVSLSL